MTQNATHTNQTTDKRTGAVRTPEVAVGTLIIAACVLGAMTWNRSSVAGASVLVVTTDVREGQVLTADDFGTIRLTSSDDIRLLPSGSFDDAVGMRATVDIAAGSPLTPSQLAPNRPVGRDEGLIGLSVDLGEAPADLEVGDDVRVLTLTRADDGSTTSAVELPTLEVWDLTEPDPMDGSRVVTLKVGVDQAAMLLGREEIRLMKVGS